MTDAPTTSSTSAMAPRVALTGSRIGGSGIDAPVIARRVVIARPVTTVAVLTTLTALFAWYCVENEGSSWNLVYVASATLVMATAVLVATRRVLVSAMVAAATVSIIIAASSVKLKLMHMAIHAYDVVFYLTSPATLTFLVSTYPLEMLQLLAACLALATAWYLLHHHDQTRVPRLYSLAALAALVWFTGLAAERKEVIYAFRNFEGGLTLSKFYDSWSATIDTLRRGELFEAAASAGAPPFASAGTCAPAEKPPHIILIHEESAVPPELVPGLAYDKAMDAMFRSSDGKFRKLRVETYAGASWLTEFSILTGMSTYAFGSMRPFVQALMAGKVKESLPQRLAACGYRNVVFYPLHRNFVSNARLYTSVGMPEIFDVKDQKAPSTTERDRFYFTNALNLFGEHLKTSNKPIFSFILTAATHQPYHYTYAPEMKVKGGDPVKDDLMHEYLRRLSLARLDLDEFKKELKRRFPRERFLLVHYGDHQPMTTYNYLSENDRMAIRSMERKLARESQAFLTYYAVDAINFTPRALSLPDYEVLDVPYLGVAILNAAGLPLSPAYRERERLMADCDGRYDGCKDQTRILSFHRRLIESGLVLPN